MKYIIFIFLLFLPFINFSQDTIFIDSAIVKNAYLHISNNSVIVAPKLKNKGAIRLENNAKLFSIQHGNKNPSAAMEVKSNTKGILFPRMTTKQIILIENPAEGLMVKDTTKGALLLFSGNYDRQTFFNAAADTFQFQNLISNVYGDSAFCVDWPIYNAINTFQKTDEINISEFDTINIYESYSCPNIWINNDSDYSLLNPVSCISDSFAIDTLLIDESKLGFSWNTGVVWLAKDTSWTEVNVSTGDTVIADIDDIYTTTDESNNTYFARPKRICLETDVNYEIIMNNVGQRYYKLIWRDPQENILIEKF